MSSENSETRFRILQAALDLLESGQGNGVRMTDIARQAGISRQAVYLHFNTRAELLVSATHYLDKLHNTDERLAASRSAPTGVKRLETYIDAWGKYIPEIHGIAKALLAMRDSDDAAAEAWDERMRAMREGCQAAIKALHHDGMLNPDYSQKTATDILWTMLSIRNWEQLTDQCGWTNKKYISEIKLLTRRIFVVNETEEA
ncbi:MAG: TetR/AcrR family transcriptional regulator [Granulosicoccus sp.]